jgi:hypothetical protein
MDSIFENNGFKNLESVLFDGDCIYRGKEGNLFIFIHCQKYEDSLNATFDKDSYPANPSIYRKDKWEKPQGKEYDKKKEKAFELSWKYIDLSLHFERRFVSSHTDIEKELYLKIKTKGLQSSLIRLAIIRKDHTYAFNVAYDTEEERNIGRNFLINLKTPVLKEILQDTSGFISMGKDNKKCSVF